ncbi:hypothetical protein NX801_12450 [Streptomyces sp. LP05-1]|uniref:DUF3106 domain-containing protein n=1 Tax=Streptomyces pyxinae TaxID=2970734 RepID=A0ABT2CGC2_9ACTN|nr:hypothetical protein [Streptomyces sp. LP05-1]MCS0636458.1 hypothetical protein [Streptomyces sp. LP05-1]
MLRFKRARPPLTEEQRNVRRNLERLLNPPRPSVRERLMRPVRWAEDLWCRHVSQRQLHQALDAARARVEAAMPPEWRSPEQARRRLARLRAQAPRDVRRELIRRAVAEAGRRTDHQRSAPDDPGSR